MGATVEQDIGYVVGRIRNDERKKIASWLRAGAGEKRAQDTNAFKEAVLPMLEELATAIERGDASE